jgi:hypothetical protein
VDIVGCVHFQVDGRSGSHVLAREAWIAAFENARTYSFISSLTAWW